MVTNIHLIETELINILKSGRDWQLEDLGGIEPLAGASRLLGNTPVMPELLHPLMVGWHTAETTDRDIYKSTLLNLLDVATTDLILMEAVDILELHRPLPDDGDECCFMLFLAKAANRDHLLSGLSRSVALDGAFRWASDNRRWQLRLLDFFIGLTSSDDTEFLRRAAKILGVAFSYWRDKELVEILRKLALVEAVRPEATFELGMAILAEALDKADSNTAVTAFLEARDWFGESESTSEHRPEASLYFDVLDLLLSFHSGATAASFDNVSARVQQHTFELHAYSEGSSSPPWLGVRQAEAMCWSALASTIAGLANSLEEPSWWDPAVVIEDALLSVYCASRSILRRDRHGGIEVMVRPRVRASVATQAGQAHQVRIWLQKNAAHQWGAEARDLIAQIDAYMEQANNPKKPSEAMSERTSLAAVIVQSTIPEEQRNILLDVISNAMSFLLSNLTASEVEIIERCCNVAQGHTDYNTNQNGMRLFDTVLLWSVRFVFNRLELTMGDDKTGAYLFERNDGSLPHEDELQQDYFYWMTTCAAGSDLEPTNIASGRADIRLRSGPERLVVEVKREEKDCSFDALFKSYAAQTTDYQNVSIRLGVLLVLDLATPNREGTPHLTSLFEMRQVLRHGECEPRLILIIKVPGRRKRPSDLTKSNVTKRRQPGQRATE